MCSRTYINIDGALDAFFVIKRQKKCAQCGGRTHEDLHPADLKPAALTTRPTVRYVLLIYHISHSYYFSFYLVYV